MGFNSVTHKDKKSRNNSKNSKDNKNTVELKNFSTLSNYYQPNRGSYKASSKGLYNEPASSHRKSLKTNATTPKQMPMMSPGIKSTLSSLNMKSKYITDNVFSVNSPNFNFGSSKRPPRAKGYVSKEKIPQGRPSDTIKKVRFAITNQHYHLLDF